MRSLGRKQTKKGALISGALLGTTLAVGVFGVASVATPSATTVEAAKGKKILAIRHLYGTPTHAVTLSPDGTRVLIVSGNDTAELWDSRSGTLLKTVSLAHVSHSDEANKIGCSLATVQDCETFVWIAKWSPDGSNFLTAASYDNVAKLWSAETGDLVRTFKHAPKSEVSDAAFSLDGRYVLTSSSDQTAKLWNARSGALLKTLSGHKKYVNSVALSRDGTQVLTGSRDGTAKLWDARTGALLNTIMVSTETWVSNAVFSPDGRFVLTTSPASAAKLWDVRLGKLQMTLGDPKVNDAEFSPDGTQILTLSYLSDTGGGVAQLWNSATGKLINSFRSADGFARGYDMGCCNRLADFSPDGMLILLSPSGSTATLWNAQSGTAVMEFGNLGDLRPILYGAVFSYDGKQVLTGYSSGSSSAAIIWALTP
jgi:WD40 repeat protein